MTDKLRNYDNNLMGRRIKRLRLQHGYTQEELGSFIGISRSSVNKIENGTTENIKRNQIEILASKLETSPIYLMGWDDPNVIPQSGGQLKKINNELNDIEASINAKLSEALKDLVKQNRINDLEDVFINIIKANNLMYKDKVLDDVTQTFIQDMIKSLIKYLDNRK